MDPLNTLPSTQPKISDQERIALAEMLRQQGLNEVSSLQLPQQQYSGAVSSPQPNAKQQQSSSQKCSFSMRIKKNWIYIVIIFILFLVMQLKVVNSVLSKNKTIFKSPIYIDLAKLIIFGLALVIIFSLPIGKE